MDIKVRNLVVTNQIPFLNASFFKKDLSAQNLKLDPSQVMHANMSNA
jgi:hypothetical protein